MSERIHEQPWNIEGDGSPIIATAIHNGHTVRPEIVGLFEISEADRLREEDPFTGEWTVIAETRVVVDMSRFEVDLNRPRDKAVYRTPDDAWGLKVWKEELPQNVVDHSLALYDRFYQAMRGLISSSIDRFGKVVLLDLHSYNHHRQGPAAEHDDPEGAPEINVGTGSIDRSRWGEVVDIFIQGMHGYDFNGRHLDVRENVKFQGGNFPRWVNGKFGEHCCALAIETKKFFMDEWSGEIYEAEYNAVKKAFEAIVPIIESALQRR